MIIRFLSCVGLVACLAMPAQATNYDNGFDAIDRIVELASNQALRSKMGEIDSRLTIAATQVPSKKPKKDLSEIHKESCDRKRQYFYRDHLKWIKKNTVSTGRNFETDVATKGRDFFETFEMIIKPYMETDASKKYLDENQSLFEPYGDSKLDIRQRMQWIALLSHILNDKIQAHQQDFSDFDTAYTIMLLSQIRCEMLIDNKLAGDDYIEEFGLEYNDGDRNPAVFALRHALEN